MVRMPRRAAALVFAALLLSSACGGRGPVSRPVPGAGRPEGEVDLVAWPGTVEDGSNDPAIDWVRPFERRTGCQVSVRYVNTSEEMVGNLRQAGVFDGGLVSSDVAGRLIGHGDVAPIDVRLVPGLQQLMAPLRRPGFATARGRVYAVPFEYGPNLLLFDSRFLRRPPTSWRITWVPPARLVQHVMRYTSSIYLADAALYLRAHDPSLGIHDPYELTKRQLEAAVALVERQGQLTERGWSQSSEEIVEFADGEVFAGVGRPIVLDLERPVPLRAVVPREGVTGWADAWMVTAHPPHPACMYRWLQWTTQPWVQAEVARWYGAAPANPAACPSLRASVGPAAGTIRYGRCGDLRFLRSLALWRTPSSDCGDGRHDCADYRAWLAAWAEANRHLASASAASSVPAGVRGSGEPWR
jgi:putative spermidine/putrescine transport system substrate-binding protein